MRVYANLVRVYGRLSNYSVSSWPWFVKSQVLGYFKPLKSFWWGGGWGGGLSNYSISSWPWFVKSQVLGIKLGLASEQYEDTSYYRIL